MSKEMWSTAARGLAALLEGDREIADGEQGCRRSPERLSRIEGVAHRLADEDQQRQHERDHHEAGEAEPRRVEVALALLQQFAERGRAGRQAEAEEVERGQRRDRAVEDERQEGQRRHHGVGQQVAEHDRAVGHAERPRRVDIFEVAGAQELGAHDADEARPRRTAASGRAG